MSLTNASVKISASSAISNPVDLGAAVGSAKINATNLYTDGTGAGQAQTMYQDTATIGAASTLSLDLSGTLLDSLNNTISFTRVVSIVVAAQAANGAPVEVREGAATGFGSWLSISGAGNGVLVPPGGGFSLSRISIEGNNSLPECRGICVTFSR